MRYIYEPRGKALEYSPLALNLYTGCSHKCSYCYAPAIRRQTMDQWACSPSAREIRIDFLEKDCADLRASGRSKDSVLLCFMSDPYQPGIDTSLTRKTLEVLGRWGQTATVLTKGGVAASRDFDLMAKFGIGFGQTIIMRDDSLRAQFEPGASTIESRIEAIKEAKARGIKTWVSVEPVVDADEALSVIEELSDWVDLWKVGKLNHNKAIEEGIDWAKFAHDAIRILDERNSKYYIKKDLLAFTKVR